MRIIGKNVSDVKVGDIFQWEDEEVWLAFCETGWVVMDTGVDDAGWWPQEAGGTAYYIGNIFDMMHKKIKNS